MGNSIVSAKFADGPFWALPAAIATVIAAILAPCLSHTLVIEDNGETTGTDDAGPCLG